ncbi:hypothetical protein HMPREF3155_04355 [Corynebacterium sp. HMSC06D04]|uniref:ATP-dependent nuclease n=1 Tax=Corynebacterium sp. HMSC06D04 TaxID=1581123 RepID=UPI0008A23BF2|nr:AAA family ATPase [Corynebacterium sp. HMSC06D04]OFT52034.1 hypothetical protein HMPREF3155_04355 [Corynebacterium sp. HMSC06D04]
MKIKHLRITNFRAIAALNEDIGPYTTFIGYNGGGKSSILHAVRWFFDDFELEPSDIFAKDAEDAKNVLKKDVKVSVTFDQLTTTDRENFGPYARGNEIVLTRIGGFDRKSKLYGERLVCKAFTELRNGTKVGEMRKQLQELRSSYEHFSNLEISSKASKSEILAALDDWEAVPENQPHLEPISDEQANHFFGAIGTDKLKVDSGFVFIPAAPDLTGQFDVSGKGSALQLLLGDILKGVVGQSVAEWTKENRDVLEQLESTVKESAARKLDQRASRVNHHLEKYLPDTKIEFQVGLQDWAPKASPNALSKMRKGGSEFLIEREGHGVQRATLLALLQATAESRSELAQDRENEKEASAEDENGNNPLIVFIEEPEVYQHPVQARLMARSFITAAHTGSVQFVVATHSPYFLDPSQLEYTFRVEGSRDGSTVRRPTLEGSLLKKQANGELDKYFLETVTESLFSQGALVVEGDTERAIFDTMPCDHSGLTLRELGVSVAVAGGADSLLTMAQVIRAFGVPTLVVRDGDSDSTIAMDTAKNRCRKEILNKYQCEPDFQNEEHLRIAREKRDQIMRSWKNSVEKFVKEARKAGLGNGLENFTWGGGVQIGESVVILGHDLESELHEWPSFRAQSKKFKLAEDFRNSKKAGVFARVASGSNFEDMPEALKNVLAATRSLVNSNFT